MAAASAAPFAAINGAVKMNTSQAYLESGKVRETKALISELCRQFYHLGWVSGTGGSITIKVHDDSVPKPQQLIVMSPSGVQKERMMEEDMYVLSPNGSVLSEPLAKPWPNKPPKCSDCGPLFLKAYEMRNAGAVIHSHGMESCLVTMMNPSSKEFRTTHMEMIKGIQGHGYYDELVVPIIENTAHERELTQSLAEAIQAYPKTTAVLVRNHGVYIWGDSWISAKTQAECYHYLFDAAIKLHQLGLDWSTPSHGLIPTQNSLLSNHRSPKVSTKAGAIDNGIGPNRSCIVLDIEGTTTPISFVTDVLFPYARDSVGKHLELTYDSAETQEDIDLLRAQVQEDLANNVVGAVPIPRDGDKVDIIAAVVANVEVMIKADRKIISLKQLQGHIWRTGFRSKEIEAVVFDDVPDALEKWHDLGIKVYIYSSGSRLAQRLLFGNTNYGDLRKHLYGYFDTTVGSKRETKSYNEISESLGVDHPSQILFVTDVYQEAIAAKAAGMNYRGRGSSSYRGRGGRGRTPEIISQLGKQKLINKDLSYDAEYQEFLEFKRKQQSTSENDSYAKIVGNEESEPNNIGFTENESKELIFYLEEKDLKWKDDPRILMQRYLDNSSFTASTYKSRHFYEQILIQNGSCEISHFTGTNKEIYNFSKIIIKKIISVEDWGISPMKEKEVFNRTSAIKYNYWDYCEAFIKVLMYENDKNKHSWFIKICANVYNIDMPNWFLVWFYHYGPTPNILPENIKLLFDKWVEISPQIIKKQEANLFIEGIASCFFFTEFSIPWIWKWLPEFGYTPTGIPCIYRTSHIKFWDKMLKIDPNTKEIFGKETIDNIQSQIKIYQDQIKKICTPSPFDHIERKFKMKSENLSKQQLITAYIEEMKKDLINKFEEDNKSSKSDSTMASAMHDAQDPNDIGIEDIFDAIKDTLMDKIGGPGPSSTSG